MYVVLPKEPIIQFKLETNSGKQTIGAKSQLISKFSFAVFKFTKKQSFVRVSALVSKKGTL